MMENKEENILMERFSLCRERKYLPLYTGKKTVHAKKEARQRGGRI